MITTINKFYETNRGWKIFGTIILVGAIVWVVYRLIKGLTIIPSKSEFSGEGKRSAMNCMVGAPCMPATGGRGTYDKDCLCQPLVMATRIFIPIYIIRQRDQDWKVPANDSQAQRIADRICALQDKIHHLEGVKIGDTQALSAILDNETIPSDFDNSNIQNWIGELQNIINRLKRLLSEGGYMMVPPCKAVRKLEEPVAPPITAQPVIM